MATSIKDKIRAAAIATPALTALLGTNPFRWYDTQLLQGTNFPAVVVQIISGRPTYVVGGMLQCSQRRIQFTLWGVNTAAGVVVLSQLEAQMRLFWNSLNLLGIPNLEQYPNFIVRDADGFEAMPLPEKQKRFFDVMIFANDSL